MPVVVKVADDRHGDARVGEARCDLRHRGAASSLLTVMRTIWEPARARAAICAAVPAASAVSVFVIDCTTIGCADPTGTCLRAR
jgi:hypothetical protein